MGPCSWLIYVNNLRVEGFSCVKYTDDTTFYTNVLDNSFGDMISSAVEAANSWASANNMLLNTDKTVLENSTSSRKHKYNKEILVYGTKILPSNHMKFLGVYIDNRLNFSLHVANVVPMRDSRLFLMRQLKSLGLNNAGLVTFYMTNVRSVLTYASPAWFSLLSDFSKNELEKVQRSATRIVLPHCSYEEHLKILELSYLYDFIVCLSKTHFIKILHNPSHPLFKRLVF